jgi:hypothetical protein
MENLFIINNKIYYEKQKIIYNKKIIKWEKLEKNLYHVKTQ